MEKIEINNILVHIERKKIKNMYLKVTAQEPKVLVKAPLRLSLRQIKLQIATREGWIRKQLAQLQEKPPLPLLSSLDKIELERLAWQMIEKWCPILGVAVSILHIRLMKSRWGSCNIVSKRICLNLQLAIKPLACIEYVVVHELVHLLEPSHNARFHRLMTQFLPDWLERKKLLHA